MLKGKNYRITKENIYGHELIGLKTKVELGKGKSGIGLKGLIVDETKNLIMLETQAGLKRVPKDNNLFEVELGDERFVMNGKDIVARPEDRIKLAWRKRL